MIINSKILTTNFNYTNIVLKKGLFCHLTTNHLRLVLKITLIMVVSISAGIIYRKTHSKLRSYSNENQILKEENHKLKEAEKINKIYYKKLSDVYGPQIHFYHPKVDQALLDLTIATVDKVKTDNNMKHLNLSPQVIAHYKKSMENQIITSLEQQKIKPNQLQLIEAISQTEKHFKKKD